MIRFLLFYGIFCSTSLFIFQEAQANDIMSILQNRAEIAETQLPKTIPYSYTMQINFSQFDSDRSKEVQAEVSVDPSKPAGSRTNIVNSTNSHSQILTGILEVIEDPKKNMAKLSSDFWCGSIHDYGSVDMSTYTAISETDTDAVLKPNPSILSEMLLRSDTERMDKAQRKMKNKLMDRIDGHITISKHDGAIKDYKAYMTETVKIKSIVKIKTKSFEQSCAVAPNGHRYILKIKESFSGTALSNKFGADLDILISDLRLLP